MLPRRVWAQLLALRAASDYLEHRAEREQGATARGAPPATGGKALADIKEAIAAIRTMYVVSLEAKRDAGFDPAAPMVNEQERIDIERMGRRMRLALEKLPERERALMTKHYWEDKNLLEAGRELGISKSWASRLHAQAVERMRAFLDDG
jgi:RNA polymerase sigma factor for flagellar operon FliA